MTSFGKTAVAVVVLLCFCTGRVHSAFSFASASSSSDGRGPTSSNAVATATNGGVAIAKDMVVNTGSGPVESTTKAAADGPGAVAVADTSLYVAGNAEVTANNFALAIQDGKGPVIAKSIVDAIAVGNEDQVLRGYVDGVAVAIGKTSANIATIAKTTVDVFFFGSGPQAAFGKAVSILFTKGCGFAQPFLQQVEANVSSRGKQQAFLKEINSDVNIIKCVFPDTCKNDGVDQRGGCCRSSNAASSGSCGMCDKGDCKHTQIWTNPKGIWVCNQGVPCGNMKPCICS